MDERSLDHICMPHRFLFCLLPNEDQIDTWAFFRKRQKSYQEHNFQKESNRDHSYLKD